MTRNKKKIDFKFADRREGALILLTFLAWYIFNDGLNIMAVSPLGILSIGNLFGTSYIRTVDFLLPTFLTSFCLALILVMRNQWKGKTEPSYDMIAGIVMMVSFIFMAIASTMQLMGAVSSTEVFWLFNITKSSLFHIGVLGFIISLVYYTFVD